MEAAKLPGNQPSAKQAMLGSVVSGILKFLLYMSSASCCTHQPLMGKRIVLGQDAS
jgi:hypothetical protein